MDGTFVGLNGDSKAQEAAASALGVDGAGDQCEQVGVGCEMKPVAVGQFLTRDGPAHEVVEETLAARPEGVGSKGACDGKFSHSSSLLNLLYTIDQGREQPRVE
jgi:hypothetical protein